jgi:hypothetical protein
MDVAHNKAVVARFDELGNSGGDLTVLESLCTPAMVNHALAAGRRQGLEGTGSSSATRAVRRTRAAGSAPSS